MLTNYCDADRKRGFDDTLGVTSKEGLKRRSHWNTVLDLQQWSGFSPSNSRTRPVVLR